MIKTLYKIYDNLSENTKIDLAKIVKQKASSYLKFNIADFDKDDLNELKNNKLITFIDDSQGIILPLGYALLESNYDIFNTYNEYELLKKIYDQLCDRILAQFIRDNYTNQDCALAIYILFMGSASEKEAFPFKRLDKTFQFYSIIHHDINYIYSRLFYSTDKRIEGLKDEVMLRNILGRNDKNGNIIKKINLYNVKLDKGQGTKYIWFDINSIEQDVEKILYALLENKENLILILNLKKLAMDYLLVNAIPYEMKLELGERILRNKILEQVIAYCNKYTDNYTSNVDDSISREEAIEIINSIKEIIIINFNNIRKLYDEITNAITKLPQIGLILIEVHYRLGNAINYINKISSDDDLKVDILQIFKEKTGDDFSELLNDSLNTSIEFFK